MVAPILIPSREVLSLFEGFIFSYEKRELSFDRTYYDVCVAMSGPRLKGEGLAAAQVLAKPLLDELGGEPILQGNRFVLRRPDGDVDAHLLAEGHRKIAELAHLVLNGSIAADSVVLWDEPESNLNPKLIKVVANFIVQLAHKGAQVILATHDYLLMRRLSLIGEHKTVPGLTIRFHALTPGTPEQGVQLQSADTLPEITDNPVVDEYVKHYDFEKTVEAAERKGGTQDWEALLASH